VFFFAPATESLIPATLKQKAYLQGPYMLKRLKILFFIVAFFNVPACQCVQTKKTIERPEHLLGQAPDETKKEITQPPVVPYAEALAYAEKNLAKVGTLVQKPDGFAYIKVDNRYIHDLFPLLHADSYYKKPPYFRRDNSPGAHISVVYADEKVKLKEVGQKFSFRLKNIIAVQPNPKTNYIILQVESPELENLRKSYGLGPKLHGHEFHISVAKKD